MAHQVLIIDDDDLVRDALFQVLTQADFEVVEAANGDEGILIYEVNSIDVVVTDILMPEKEGIETIMELRRKYPDVRIVAMSGGNFIDGQKYLNMAAQLGADRVLLKPFRPKELLETVRDLLPCE